MLIKTAWREKDRVKYFNYIRNFPGQTLRLVLFDVHQTLSFSLDSFGYWVRDDDNFYLKLAYGRWKYFSSQVISLKDVCIIIYLKWFVNTNYDVHFHQVIDSLQQFYRQFHRPFEFWKINPIFRIKLMVLNIFEFKIFSYWAAFKIRLILDSPRHHLNTTHRHNPELWVRISHHTSDQRSWRNEILFICS